MGGCGEIEGGFFTARTSCGNDGYLFVIRGGLELLIVRIWGAVERRLCEEVRNPRRWHKASATTP